MRKAKFTKRTSVALTQEMHDLIESLSNIKEISLGESFRIVLEAGLATISGEEAHDGD